jgi:hypothetical protein
MLNKGDLQDCDRAFPAVVIVTYACCSPSFFTGYPAVVKLKSCTKIASFGGQPLCHPWQNVLLLELA